MVSSSRVCCYSKRKKKKKLEAREDCAAGTGRASVFFFSLLCRRPRWRVLLPPTPPPPPPPPAPPHTHTHTSLPCQTKAPGPLVLVQDQQAEAHLSHASFIVFPSGLPFSNIVLMRIRLFTFAERLRNGTRRRRRRAVGAVLPPRVLVASVVRRAAVWTRLASCRTAVVRALCVLYPVHGSHPAYQCHRQQLLAHVRTRAARRVGVLELEECG